VAFTSDSISRMNRSSKTPSLLPAVQGNKAKPRMLLSLGIGKDRARESSGFPRPVSPGGGTAGRAQTRFHPGPFGSGRVPRTEGRRSTLRPAPFSR
jgi:hypothetical protein